MLIHSASQLLTLAGGPQRGHTLGRLGIIPNGAVLLQDQLIAAVGPTPELLAAYPNEPALDAGGKVVAEDKGYFPDKWHQPNFIDCIRSRKRPNADVEQSHYSACLVHLGNVAYRTGHQRLMFDSQNETFVNNQEANRLLKPAYREQYRVPEVV